MDDLAASPMTTNAEATGPGRTVEGADTPSHFGRQNHGSQTVRTDADIEADARDLFAGPGEMRALCRGFDWSATPLGPVAQWSQSLRTIADTVLASAFPMIVLWGPDLVQIYNDGYIAILGTKHPQGLGMPTRECWSEMWHFNEPIYKRVLQSETIYFEDQLYTLARNGPEAPLDDVYITLSYSPVRDETGETGGVLVTLLETTARVAARQLEGELESLVSALEIERARLSSVFQQSPSFLAVLHGPEHVFQLANEAYLDLVGHHDIVGKPLLDAIPELRGQGFEGLLNSVLDTGTPFVGREVPAMVGRGENGSLVQIFVDFVFQPLTEAGGTRSGVVVHGSEVTEHVNARTEVARLLAESEASRAAVEAANVQLAEQQLELELSNTQLTEQQLEAELTNQQLQENASELEMQAEELQAAADELAERTAAAEAAEEQLRTVFAQAPASVSVTTGPEHRIVLMNARAQAVLGRSDLVGRTIADAFPELESQGFLALLDRVYATGEPYAANDVAAILEKPGGVADKHWFDIAYQPLRNAEGEITGILQHTVEVTDRVRAREADVEREQQFRTLANAIPTLAWTATPDGYLDWYNARWYEYTGTTPEQMQGWGWQSVQDPAVLPEVLREWQKSIATGSQFEMTFPLRRADGQFRSFLTRVLPLRDSNGKVVRWFGTNTDVESERAALRAAELARTAAEASEIRYRTLTEVLPVQVWTATPDGALDYVGEQTSSYFGEPAAALLGVGWTRFVHPEDLQRAADRWARARMTGSPYEAEFRLLRFDGDYRWHITRALPTRSAWGEITGWVGSNTDVEGERRARAEAEEAGQAAETANRAKSDFLAVMSHELRTPLNAIGGYTELISLGIRGPVTEAQLEDLARIQRSQQHLLGLINDVLNVVRLGSGQLSYDVTDIAINAAMLRVEELILPQLEAKGLKYEHAACDPQLVVRADAEKLRQVLVNLLSNATKYTDAGSVRVWCDATDDVVRIHVRDTGPGIAADQLDRIFEPFVQIPRKANRPSEGVGLGLAISRDLARGMAGDITAESTLGGGSTFTLTLTRAAR